MRRNLRDVAAACLVSLVVVAATVEFALAQGKGTDARELIAVLDLDVAGTTPAQASAVTDRLREELLRSGAFTLVDRSQLEAVLNEQALQQTGCTSQECAVQVGRILGIRKIVSGKVTKLDPELWQLSTLVVDVETAETLRAETVIHEGNFVGLLRTGVADMAARLSGRASVAAPLGLSPGRIFVTSDPPGAEIAIDGVPLRQQSNSLIENIAAGKHTLTVTKGTLMGAAAVTVQPGQIARVEITMAPRPAVMDVQSIPTNASVWLDGKEVGKTPLTIDVDAGDHAVEVRAEKHLPAIRRLRLAPGETEQVQFDLSLRANLQVESVPSNAAVILDYSEIGRTPLKQDLAAGNYRLVLRAEGYLDATRQIDLSRGGPAQFRIELEPLAAIEVQSTPSNATVTVNGRTIGRTPLVGTIEAGQYRLEVQHDGYFEATKTVDLSNKHSNRFQAALASTAPWDAYKSDHSSWNLKRWSATAGAVLLTLYALSQAQAAAGAIDEANQTGSLQTYQAAQTTAESAKTQSDAGYLLALSLGGLAWWVHRGEPETPDTPPSRIELSAHTSPGDVSGVAVAWRW